MTYTKGKWHIEKHSGHARTERFVVCAEDYDNRVAVLSLNGAPHGDDGVSFDNAKLITTAPELLDELIAVTNELVMQIALRFNDPHLEDIRTKNPIVANALSVIAKAQGEHEVPS